MGNEFNVELNVPVISAISPMDAVPDLSDPFDRNEITRCRNMENPIAFRGPEVDIIERDFLLT